jgi:hypothetical protein
MTTHVQWVRLLRQEVCQGGPKPLFARRAGVGAAIDDELSSQACHADGDALIPIRQSRDITACHRAMHNLPSIWSDPEPAADPTGTEEDSSQLVAGRSRAGTRTPGDRPLSFRTALCTLGSPPAPGHRAISISPIIPISDGGFKPQFPCHRWAQGPSRRHSVCPGGGSSPVRVDPPRVLYSL